MDGDGFIDPTPDNPVEAARFLSFLDLTPILAVLESFYCEPWRHRHPPEAMLRLYALYRLRRCKFLTELWRILDGEVLRLLGFSWRPSYKTLWHWLNVRIGPEGLMVIHEELMRVIRDALKNHGIELGLMIAGDASPIQALPGDAETAYNGYYRKLCYLVHRLVCCVTNLTLTWAVTPGNVDETSMFLPLFLKAITQGVIPGEACFDNGYSSPRIYALLGLLGVKPLIGFRRNAKPDWRGKPETLRLRFRKMVEAGILTADRLKALGLSPEPEENTIEEILSGLALAGQHEYVGAYYRNRSLEEFQRDSESWLERYAQLHNMVEGSNGHQKDWLSLDDLRGRGLRKAVIHAALTMLTEAMVAYTRVQNGVMEGLTSLAGLK